MLICNFHEIRPDVELMDNIFVKMLSLIYFLGALMYEPFFVDTHTCLFTRVCVVFNYRVP